jgi:excisionase family DNA binding protein
MPEFRRRNYYGGGLASSRRAGAIVERQARVPGGWMTTAEAGRELRITARDVRILAEGGRIKAERFGRSWVLSREAVLAYAAAQRPQGVQKDTPSLH